MPQPWEMDWSQGQKPASGPIMGAPVDPSKRAGEARAQSAEQRAREDQAFQRQKFATEQERAARLEKKDSAGTVDEKKVATLTTRLVGAFGDISSITGKDPSAQEPGLIETLRGGLQPGGLLGIPVRKIAGSNRRTVYDAQRDALDALLTLGTGAAYNSEQLDAQTVAYFPQYDDDPSERDYKNRRFQRLMAAAKANAGPAWAQVEPAIAPFMSSLNGETDEPEAASDAPIGYGNGLPAGETPGPDDRQKVATGGERFINDKEANSTIYSMWQDGKSNDEIAAYARTRGYNIQFDPKTEEYARKHPGYNPFPPLGRTQKTTMRQKAATSALGGYLGGASNALTLGLNDEIYGAGAAALGGDYTQARDEFQGMKRGVADASPIADLVGNIAGGLLLGPTAAAVGSRLAPGATAGLVNLAANNPIKTAALYGAGYGAGETNQNRLGGAAVGAAAGVGGGLVGKYAITPIARAIADSPVGQKLNDLAAWGVNRARARKPGISNADEVAEAGAQEGVDVNRAMMDPALENHVTGVDASMAGGPKFQRGMSNIEGQIEGRVNDLGQGGTPLNKVAQGQLAQGAGERFIKNSGKEASALYTRAEKMAGSAKVEPKTSLGVVDDTITRLSETPSTNAAEIAFLKGLKSDLSKDLSVGGLRRMRTSLRKKISKGDLVFGEDEAAVLGVMDAAADDIASGLEKQGLGNAAQAFKRADGAYRGRMEYINGTLQKIIGKRGSNLSAEKVADNLTAMARGKDEIGVKKFLDTLDPEERIDTAATFAEALGKNGKENFTVDTFLRQTSEKNFPQGALRVVFGEEGAASIGRLRVLSKEVTRVTGAMNSRKSGTAVGNDYRSWLFNTVLGTAPGAASGNMTTAIAGAGLTLGAKAGRDIISARALLSKDITKWLAQAPRTTNPKAINEHLSQLSAVAGSQSAYRMDAQQIANYLRDAITSKSTTAAAAGEQEQN